MESEQREHVPVVAASPEMLALLRIAEQQVRDGKVQPRPVREL
jgi:hypothetical protein